MKTLNNIVLVSPGEEASQLSPGKEWYSSLIDNLGLVLSKYANAGLRPMPADDGNVLKSIEPESTIVFLNTALPSLSEKLDSFDPDDSERYILLNVSNIPVTELPGILRNAWSTDLYDLEEGNSRYWSRLLDIVARIRKNAADRSSGEDPVEKPVVYLAQCEQDVLTNRYILERELSEHGLKTLPDQDLRYAGDGLKSQVQKLVDQSRMSIHLLGNSYGESLTDTGRSLAEEQVHYVSEYLEAIENDPIHSQKELVRLIWMDPEFKPSDAQQEAFISQLRQNIENLKRTEIIQTPLELFKSLVLKRLKQEGKENDGPTKEEADGSLVYILNSPEDKDEADKLSSALKNEGLRTGMLNFEKDRRKLLSRHRKLLQTCDAAVILYGSTNRPWLRSKLMDLLKAPGLGRGRMLSSKQVLACKNDSLEDYKLPSGIGLTREKDIVKAVPSIIKNLK